MRPIALLRGLQALVWSVALTSAGATAVHAAGVVSDPARRIPAADGTDASAVAIGRAAAEQRAGNLRGVVECLEALDFSGTPRFADADRAAFLLGRAYLELGSLERFARLARQVEGWGRSGPFTDWFAFHRRRIEADTLATAARTTAPDTTGVVAAPGASLDADPAWAALASADTGTVLGRDLMGATLLRQAVEVLERGEDARTLLEAVPADSRYGSRARHLLGLACMERGETARGVAILEALRAQDSTYSGRREVMLALAGHQLDGGDWLAAHEIYRDVDRDWNGNRAALRKALTTSEFDPLWNVWRSNAPASDVVALDATPARALADRLASAAVDRAAPTATTSPFAAAANPPIPRWTPAPPPPEDWAAVGASERELGEARYALERVRWATAAERERLERQRHYLEHGGHKVREEERLLRERVAMLDSLRSALEALDMNLRGVRDSATRRIVRHAADIVASCERSLLWMRGIRHFNLEGPHLGRPTAPPGEVGPDSVLAAEERLTRAIATEVGRIAIELPALLERSYAQAWRPRFIDRAKRLGAEADRSLAWARALGSSIDSSFLASSTSEWLEEMATRQHQLERRADSLSAAHLVLRARVARAAVEHGLADLDVEREAIEYGLAASEYGLSVRLPRPGAADSAAAQGGRGGFAAGAAPAGSADETEDPEAARWRKPAITTISAFLAHHPGSEARGEMRFRLADLLLVDERQTFHERMAVYVKNQSEGRSGGELPVLSYASALELYRTILEEDTTFAHLDAVLFNAGMILADQSDPEAEVFFDFLVTNYPASPYVQESYLRLGDMRFAARRYGDCVEPYQHAAAGPDPSLQAIALYKLGWAHYNQDRHAEAARAFGGVLDLYASGHRVEIQADIEKEAETYLVHALAGAGGAAAFERHFQGRDARPYERRVLMSLAQHFRRNGRFEEAIAADELCIRRYPLDPDALLSAQRVSDTYQRWERPDLGREAQRTLAPKFAPQGRWYDAQRSDSVRAEGAAFARAGWLSLAEHHHRQARRDGSPDEYRKALRLYETVLLTFTNDPERARLELRAGEVCSELGQYEFALGHARAAATGPDSIAVQALWMRVAVSDAWYESSRSAGANGKQGLGRDTLARAVQTTSAELLERYPNHPRGADLAWRGAQLSFAHGWFERAAGDFGKMAERYPSDPRAPRAAALRADALFRLGDYDQAAVAYQNAVAVAHAAGIDSLERRCAAAIPVSEFRHAESVTMADSSSKKGAELFERVAARWPGYENAHDAQYRAGLGYLRAHAPREAVKAMETLIREFPASEYVPDAHLQVARTWESMGNRTEAAEAYLRFAERYPKDPSSRDAWLKAADLHAAAGNDTRADALRLAYIERYPDDVETAFEILEALARRELATVGPGRPISTLIGAAETPAAAAKKTGKKGATEAAAKPARPAPSSHLAAYLALARKHPKMASGSLIAQVRFLEGEEAYASYSTLRLRQPLKKSIAAKQQSLDDVMARYKRTLELGDSEWAHASTFRIGESLVGFGEALEASERPADLRGDNLAAYEDVLMVRSQAFYDRAEDVWSELLRQKAQKAPGDAWVERAQQALWHRLGDRFAYRAEAEVPLVRATAPDPKKDGERDTALLGPNDGTKDPSASEGPR